MYLHAHVIISILFSYHRDSSSCIILNSIAHVVTKFVNISCGLDGRSAEHLKHCSDVIIPLLSMCFTSLFVHGILPESMISVVLVPIVKNKNASICSKSNYRPVALASIVSKVFGNIIYDHIAYSLITCDNQFGFKDKHSTDMCI